MWGGFGAALSKAAALANQTIQDLDREAGLTDPDTGLLLGGGGETNKPSPDRDVSWNEEDGDVEGDWKDEEEEVDLDVQQNETNEKIVGNDDQLTSGQAAADEQLQSRDDPYYCNDPRISITGSPDLLPPEEGGKQISGTIVTPMHSPHDLQSDDVVEQAAEEQIEPHCSTDGLDNGSSTGTTAADDTIALVDNDTLAQIHDPHDVTTDINAAEEENGVAELGSNDAETIPCSSVEPDDVTARDDVLSIFSLGNAVSINEAHKSSTLEIKEDAPVEEEEITKTSSVGPQQVSSTAESSATTTERAKHDNEGSASTETSSANAVLIQELRAQLAEREGQLFSKTQQLSKLEDLYSSERQHLQQSHEKEIKKIKEEAKRRLSNWRERVEAADAVTQQLEGLREEGAKMARREADANEKAKRARNELKDMIEDLEITKAAETKARQKIADLEVQLKTTLEELNSARKGESQAGKLDNDLREARDMSEKRAAMILKLEHDVKVLKASNVELGSALKNTEHHAAIETEEERRKLVQEKHDLTSYWQSKLKQTEDDAEEREAKLRKSVEEIRKSLTEAERRAHTTASEMELNTVPLLRQLEDAEARHRKRASEWAETETKLRHYMVQNTTKIDELQSELSELQKSYADLDKAAIEYQNSIKDLKVQLASESAKAGELETKKEKLEEEISRRKKEYERLEVSANENAARIRNDLHRALQDAEETLSNVRNQLNHERRARAELEKEMNHHRNHRGSFVMDAADDELSQNGKKEVAEDSVTASETPKQRIRKSEGQAEILAGALGGLIDDDSDADSLSGANLAGQTTMSVLQQSEMAKRAIEVKELRGRLKALEDQNSQLLQILGESRSAREELPEALRRLDELAKENEQLRQENQALQDDLVDVRQSFHMTMDQLTNVPDKTSLQRTVNR